MPVVRLLSSDASQKQRSAKQASHGSGSLLNIGEFVCEPSAAHRGGKIGVLREWFAATSSPRLTRRRGTKWGDAAKPSDNVRSVPGAAYRPAVRPPFLPNRFLTISHGRRCGAPLWRWSMELVEVRPQRSRSRQAAAREAEQEIKFLQQILFVRRNHAARWPKKAEPPRRRSRREETGRRVGGEEKRPKEKFEFLNIWPRRSPFLRNVSPRSPSNCRTRPKTLRFWEAQGGVRRRRSSTQLQRH